MKALRFSLKKLLCLRAKIQQHGKSTATHIVQEIFFLSSFLVVFLLFLIARIRNKFCKKNPKSVYFMGNNYSTFYALAESLKKRGWKAISVNPDKGCPFVQNQHKFMNLYSTKDSYKVFLDIIFNYQFLHVYNRTWNSITVNPLLTRFLSAKNLRKCGVLIIYTPSGCLDGSTSAEINELTPGVCNKCIWQGNDLVCNDKTNQKKIDWIVQNCVLFSNEVDLPKKLSYTDIGLRLPLSPACADALSPSLKVPEEFKIPKKKNEIVVFTAFGNQHIRTNEQRDIKGKKYMLSAINRLTEEGYPIKHFHATSILSKDMKYYQSQADIIIDQLNYGTIGSAAREGMMLGKPVICHVSDLVRSSNIAMRDCPAVDATEDSIYDVLKGLVLMSPSERLAIGKKSREWMLKWFEADVCAARYEKITECILNKEPLDPQERFV